MGTGEVPTATGGPPKLLPQPATFMTVTFMFPVIRPALLMKTCRKAMTVTAVVGAVNVVTVS